MLPQLSGLYNLSLLDLGPFFSPPVRMVRQANDSPLSGHIHGLWRFAITSMMSPLWQSLAPSSKNTQSLGNCLDFSHKIILTHSVAECEALDFFFFTFLLRSSFCSVLSKSPLAPAVFDFLLLLQVCAGKLSMPQKGKVTKQVPENLVTSVPNLNFIPNFNSTRQPTHLLRDPLQVSQWPLCGPKLLVQRPGQLPGQQRWGALPDNSRWVTDSNIGHSQPPSRFKWSSSSWSTTAAHYLCSWLMDCDH